MGGRGALKIDSSVHCLANSAQSTSNLVYDNRSDMEGGEIRLPAISGGPSKAGLFRDAFWPGVESYVKAHRLLDRYPLFGSIGLHFHPMKDLRNYASAQELAEDWNPAKEKPVGKLTASYMYKFLLFCEDSAAEYFFIKRGGRLLWLVRKVGGYVYDPRPEDPNWGCHRVAFEFVRPATSEEQAVRQGQARRAFAWITFDAPPSTEPKLAALDSLSVHEMLTEGKVRKRKAPVKGAVVTLDSVFTERVGIPVAAAAAGAGAGAGAPVLQQGTLAPTKEPAPLRPALLEAPEAPLSVERVEVVKVRPFEHEGTAYYREPAKNKLYKRMANGSIGPYLGRWNPRLKTVDLTVPDTDGE
jgi:hypothetical protein